MSEIDYAARVAKGAALLDEKRPGWERLLDLDRLNIANGNTCVTAQLSGVSDYSVGQQQLGLDDDSYVAHGFNADSSCGCCRPGDLPEDYDQQDAYAKLSVLWKGLITERLAAPEPPAEEQPT